MQRTRSFTPFKKLGTAIVLASTTLVQLPGLAQAPVQLAQRSTGVIYVRREVSGPAPGGRYRGGGSRTVDSQALCPVTSVPLTALVPFEEVYRPGRENLPSAINVWGYTTSDRPTFWVYVPYSNAAIPARFSIDDEDAGTTIYETTVTLPKQPGVIGIPLPKSAPTLQLGKRYRWFFSLSCMTPATNSAAIDNVYVEAVVIRENPKANLASQLTSSPSLQNAIAYAQAGFWHDALTTLAELRRQRPQDDTLATAWKELLSGISTSSAAQQNFNLEQISSQPLVN
jgi:hypothetical protein